MNNKKYKIVEIVAWSVVAVVLTVVLVGFMHKNSFEIDGLFGIKSNSKMKSIKEYTIDDMDQLKNISVDMSQGKVELTESEDDNIYIIFKSNKDIDSEKYLEVDKSSSALDIKTVQKSKIHFTNNTSMGIELQIPKSYNQDLNIVTDVGDVKVREELNLKNLSVNTDVGDIKLDKDIKCDLYEIKTDTGDIKISSIDGKGSIESDIGDIKCGIDGIRGDIDIVSNIGDVDLDVSRDLEFKLKTDKLPDDMDIDFDNISKDDDFYGEYGENPLHVISVKVDVGNLDIE